jgi:hypothetical protein
VADDAQSITDESIVDMARSAGASELTVMRRLLGLPVRGRVGLRVDEAIAHWRDIQAAKAAAQ